MPIRPGDAATHRFSVDAAKMRLFQELSQDASAVHVDDAFARSRGFERRIVYGGIMLAELSHVLGAMLPGDRGVSLSWRIDYRRALYVDELAELRLEVTHVSPGTGGVEAKFTITGPNGVVATGRTQSLAPTDDIAADA